MEIKLKWRKYNTNIEETKAVKKALAKIGQSKAKVRHGKGMGSGWLKVYIPKQPGNFFDNLMYFTKFLMEVTERSGEYDGRIQIIFI